MKEKKMTTFSSALIWFGAAVSIAEILTGTLIAPLGMEKGIAAILTGHLIGCLLLYLAARIGADTEKSAMDTVKGSFGKQGSILFSLMNITQLIGWTAVMIIGGARAVGSILNNPLGIEGESVWCILIGALILLWIRIGMKNLSKINAVAMSALFLCTIVLSFLVFRGEQMDIGTGLSFGAAVELSAAMPLSWLPLISDYVKAAEKPQKSAFVSTVVYFITSCWMYTIGLGAAIFTGETDIAQIMLQAGLGLMGVIIIIFSTVTTTFLDVYSAGVSFASITTKAKEKWVAAAACVAGSLLAIFTPIEQYENFLYFIGSVFAPMTAILITDYYILKRDHSSQKLDVWNLILWAVGFVLYQLLISVNTVMGSTLPVMLIVCILCIIVNGGRKYAERNSK